MINALVLLMTLLCVMSIGMAGMGLIQFLPDRLQNKIKYFHER